MSDALTANLVHFVRYLRSRGIAVVPQTAQDLATAVDIVGLADRRDLYAAFRALCVNRPTELPAFDDAFEYFFGFGGLVTAASRKPVAGAPKPATTPLRTTVPVVSTVGEDAIDLDEIEEIIGGSPAERLATRDFRDLSVDEKEEVRRIIAKLRFVAADTSSRRWVGATSGTRPDLRRTLRRLARPEGDLMLLEMRSPKPRRRPLVVLADISGSMEQYSEMFLHFMHAAGGRLGRMEAFVFATRLTRITRQLRHKLPDEALRQVGGTVEDWSGGTRIGEILDEFNHTWARRVARGGPIGLIISDGWDTGDPELLDRSMRRFARSMHRVVWLNPLASRSGFAPETRGMRTVLPYVDDFLAAGTLLDLREVVSLLESIPARR